MLYNGHARAQRSIKVVETQDLASLRGTLLWAPRKGQAQEPALQLRLFAETKLPPTKVGGFARVAED